MILESGNHSLTSTLLIENVKSFSIVSLSGDTWILCSRLAAFKFVNVSIVKVMNITVANCGGEIAVFELQHVHNAVLNECRLVSSNGTVIIAYSSSIEIRTSVVQNSICERGVTRFNESKVVIENSHFLSNQVHNFALLYAFNNSMLEIIESVFKNNTVERIGIIQLHLSQGMFENVSILENQCYFGTLHMFESSLKTHGELNALYNVAQLSSFYLVRSQVIFTGEMLFAENRGTILLTNSNVTFSASCKFINNTAKRRGGAITAIQSNVHFVEGTMFENNSAGIGGAISIYESKLHIDNTFFILNNTALEMGGGIYLYQSEMVCQGLCLISRNIAADRGGGIHAFGSSIFVGNKIGTHSSGNQSLILSYNRAAFGGGLSLEAYSRLYGIGESDYPYEIKFLGNNASSYGGAIFVDDNSIPAICAQTHSSLTSFECFLQTLYFTPLNSFVFSENHALKEGSVLYGGLLDRCSMSIFSHIYEDKYKITDTKYTVDSSALSALDYFRNVTRTNDLQTIASSAVRICLCLSEKPNCNHTNYSVEVVKGEEFSISLVAVNHVKRPVKATIFSKTKSLRGYVKGIQSERNISNVCTNLTFNVYSHKKDTDSLIIFADGPCKDMGISKSEVKIFFKDCTCPVGFALHVQDYTENSLECECKCHHDIYEFTTKCNQTTKSIFREDNFWIKQVNRNGYKGYITYRDCPFDYCRSPQPGIWINLEIPDKQCAANRTGILCGMCKADYSLSIGSSHCMICSKLYPIFTILLIIGVIVFGLVLVVIILVFNITVATGTINGILFYANLVSTSSSIFLPFSKPNPFTVLIAWLNLSIGFDACFYEGMDEYVKTWLLLAFPAYVISLVIAIILIGRCSSRFANLIGKRDPVATLATLLLLSYTKILQAVIKVLSSTKLKYPDGSIDVVWLPDANVLYIWSKHFPLFLVAVLTSIIGLAYTILLFTWQWLLKLPRLWATRWIRSTKLNSFIYTYHVPYAAPYRYWTGLLLLARIVLYVIIDVFHDHNVRLLGITLITSCLLVLKAILSDRVYQNKFVDYLDTASVVNILVFSLVTFYSTASKSSKVQEAAAYISVGIAIVTSVIIVIYHLKSIVRDYNILKNCSIIRRMCQEENQRRLNETHMTSPSVGVTSSEVSVTDEQVTESHEELPSGNVVINKLNCSSFADTNHLREPLLL